MRKKFLEGLTENQIIELKKQIERFERVKNEKRNIIDIDKEPMLKEGTLIHGTSFNKDVLSSISKTGIITGQYFDIQEDGETYYCADFHRIYKDVELSSYNKNFSYNDGRCPFGKFGKNQVAFLIYPDKRLDEITKYDCYKDNGIESEITKSFVNMSGLPIENENKKRASSILFGIPSNFINGIVLGDNIVKKENIDFLVKEFKGAFIIRNNGDLLYKYGDSEEILNLRIEKVAKTIEYEKELTNSKKLLDQIKEMNDEKEKMWVAISSIPVEYISKIFKNLGYQGDCDIYAENLKNQYEKHK